MSAPATAPKPALEELSVLAIDVGGSAIKYGLCNAQGNLTDKSSTPTPNNPDSTLDDFIATIKGIYEGFIQAGKRVDGIAISIPGCVNPDGSMRTGGAISYNYGAPLADLIEEATGLRPVIENDAKAAAAAELWIGSLQGVSSAAVLILGTGLGGAFVINGSVYQGPHGSAGELSAFVHNIPHFSHDRSCEAQNVSATGLILHACEALGLEHNFTADVATRKFPIDGKKVFELYHEGNETIKQVIADFGYETGKLIFNLCVVLDLQKVAIGGGISAQQCLIDAIYAGTVKAWDTNPISNLKPPLITMPEVTVCKFHNDANLIGAVHQYLERHGYLAK